MTNCPIDIGALGISDSTYGGTDIGDEPKLARIDSDVPKAMTNSMKTKLTYLRIHSSLLLFTLIKTSLILYSAAKVRLFCCAAASQRLWISNINFIFARIGKMYHDKRQEDKT